ncbi:MAG TPA: thymidine phosphorylase [Gemmatimonadales bacterium]|jgi:pyrimidine-nucleoside phosphorylase|nr:thymidine phosphorylase [Gemmatimonadales bacterium]
MLVASLIERKRDGKPLTADEWSELVTEYTAGRVPDYQVSALLMAVLWRGMESSELDALTQALLDSGDRLHFEGFVKPLVDKHSTGGVGDKVSIVLVPVVAACGVAVPMMSGRGLGHTGGTADKLESIPGFRTGLSLEEAGRQVRSLGCAMLRQTGEITPADGKLYALRDVTATVESIPLIAASIMSKKLAEGLGGLVLDVKTGSGAFLPGLDQALELARTMIQLGERNGCPSVALLTAMDRPLGRALGNALEIEESILALQGRGPADVMAVTLALGDEMLVLAGVARDRGAARRAQEEAITSGAALEMFGRMVEAQGGDRRIVDDPSLLPQARAVEIYRAPDAGVVSRVEPRLIGRAIVELGGGRRALDDAIDHSVGFVITVKPGETVSEGEPIASVFARDKAGIDAAFRALSHAIVIGGELDALPLISHRVTAQGVEVLP